VGYTCPSGNFSAVNGQCSDAGYATPFETASDASNVPYAIPLNVLQGYNVFTPQNVIPLQRGDFFALSQTVGKVAIDRSPANPNRVGDMWLGAGGQPMAAAGKLTANYSYLQWVFRSFYF